MTVESTPDQPHDTAPDTAPAEERFDQRDVDRHVMASLRYDRRARAQEDAATDLLEHVLGVVVDSVAPPPPPPKTLADLWGLSFGELAEFSELQKDGATYAQLIAFLNKDR